MPVAIGSLDEPGKPAKVVAQADSPAVEVGGDVWLYDAARGVPTRFTFDPAREGSAVWSPDGTTVYFFSDRGEGRTRNNLYRKAANGTGSEELLLDDDESKRPTTISPDGRLLMYSRNDAKARVDLWVVPLAPETGGAKPQPRAFLQTPFSEGNAQFSPDGQWVAYQSNESGQAEIYVAPFPGPGGKRQISFGGGVGARWRRDGREIFYHSDGQLMAAEVLARSGTLEIGKVQKLFGGITRDWRGWSRYDVSASGQKFLVADEVADNTFTLTLLQNWTATLRK